MPDFKAFFGGFHALIYDPLQYVVFSLRCTYNILWQKFSNIIKKSKISADVQLCRNMNTVLANAQAEGRIPGSVYDVLYLQNEAGYVIGNLNATSEGYYYAWDQAKNQMIYIMDDLKTVYYPEDYTLVPGNCWITVGTKEEAEFIGNKGYNLALERDFEEDIVLTSIVSIDTLGFAMNGSVTMSSGENDVKTAYLIGSFGETNLSNVGATSIVTSGTTASLNISGSAATSVTIGGAVNNYSASGVSNSVISSVGRVNTVGASNTSSIVNNGVNSIKTNNSSASITNGGDGKAHVTSKENIDSIRNQVENGANTFEGKTIQLDNNINLSNIAFSPISNFYRGKNTDNYFRGTFDGNGYEIQNLANNGFTIAGLNAGWNDTSVYMGNPPVRYKEACYGLFATTWDAEIKNISVTCDIDMIADSQNQSVGDSIGGLVGCAYGNYIKISNCTVSGTIKGFDSVAAFVGRCYCQQVEFVNCHNNANVTGVRKVAAMTAFINFNKNGGDSSVEKKFTCEKCSNSGTITKLGNAKYFELNAYKCIEDTKSENFGKIDLNAPFFKSNGAEDTTANNEVSIIMASQGTPSGIVTTTSFGDFENTGKMVVGYKTQTEISNPILINKMS